MPRLTRKTPSYRHFKARNLAFVEIDGKRHYLGPYDTQESRDAIIAEWLANARSLPSRADSEAVDERISVTVIGLDDPPRTRRVHGAHSQNRRARRRG